VFSPAMQYKSLGRQGDIGLSKIGLKKDSLLTWVLEEMM